MDQGHHFQVDGGNISAVVAGQFFDELDTIGEDDGSFTLTVPATAKPTSSSKAARRPPAVAVR